jgi:hypothetical protein
MVEGGLDKSKGPTRAASTAVPQTGSGTSHERCIYKHRTTLWCRWWATLDCRSSPTPTPTPHPHTVSPPPTPHHHHHRLAHRSEKYTPNTHMNSLTGGHSPDCTPPGCTWSATHACRPRPPLDPRPRLRPHPHPRHGLSASPPPPRPPRRRGRPPPPPRRPPPPPGPRPHPCPPRTPWSPPHHSGGGGRGRRWRWRWWGAGAWAWALPRGHPPQGTCMGCLRRAGWNGTVQSGAVEQRT